MLYNPEIPLQDRGILVHVHWYMYTGMYGSIVHNENQKNKTKNIKKSQKFLWWEDGMDK